MAYQPKSYKKFVATAATATLVASAIVPAAFANEAETAAFSDVPKSYEAAIDFVVSNNISKGLTETKYGIDAQIKRGDVAIIIANAAGLNNKDAQASGFKDVPTRGTLAVNSLKAAGIVDGKSTTNFGFADSITRGEAAIMLQRAFKLKGDVKDVKFTDVSDRYDDAVAALLANKVTKGVSTTKFGTDNPIKRGDFAKFIFALKDLVELPTNEASVASVSAINAGQIQVAFKTSITKDSVIDTDGTLKTGVLSVAKVSGTGNVTVDGTSRATLSEDGKTLTVSAATGAFNNVSFVATTTDAIKATDGSPIGAFTSNVITASDAVAPIITNVERQNASTVRIYFSEPLSDEGNFSFKLANGNSTADVNVTATASTLAAGYVELTLGSSIPAGTDVTATVIGARDIAGNVVSPNPFTVTFSRGQLDGIAPTVSSITPNGLNSFEVKFSEEVQGFTAADLTVGGTPLTEDNADGTFTGSEARVVQDSTDKTKYTVTLATPISVSASDSAALVTVAIDAEGVNDLSGESNAAFSRVVTFSADSTAPTLVSSEIVRNATGEEVLRLRFSEAVTEGTVNAISATQVRNYVTTNGTLNLSAGTVSSTNASEFSVRLADVTFDPTGVTTATALQNGAVYSATLNGFTDSANNALADTRISFTRGADTLTVAQTVTGVSTTSGTPSEVAVSFAQNVEGASATNLANYTIQGVTIANAEIRSGSENVVYLTLAPNSNTLSGVRNITVNNVKTRDGVTMTNAFTGTVDLDENVAPTFTAALTQPDEVTLSFSEAVTNVTESPTAVADFAVFIGNTNATELTGAAAITVTETAVDGDTVTLGLSRDLTTAEAAQTITVRPTNDTNVEDNVGNELSFTSVTVSR